VIDQLWRDCLTILLGIAKPPAAEAIAGRGGRALVAQADLGTREACERLVAQARDELGGLDVWVNNAGVDVLTGEAAAWEWERKRDALLAVDLKGTIACSYAAAEVMRAQERGGAIVNMSWDHVTTGMAGDDPQPFSAVKGGVLAFSRSLARAVAPDVRVNVLCPGWIETSFAEQADREFHCSVAEATPPAAGPPAPPRRRTQPAPTPWSTCPKGSKPRRTARPLFRAHLAAGPGRWTGATGGCAAADGAYRQGRYRRPKRRGRCRRFRTSRRGAA
jgi:NAD(P)-dependent dehydrogenase (short-subunit alcohol dehydrogenase family)